MALQRAASISNESSNLLSIIESSALEVPTEFQQGNDFQSAAAQIDSTPLTTPSYYTGVDWARIAQYGPAPDGIGDARFTKQGIWKHGWRIVHRDANRAFWLCRMCHSRKSTEHHIYEVTNGTAGASRHLKAKHILATPKKRGIDELIATANSRGSSSPSTTSRTGLNAYYNEFHPHEFKALLLAWIVEDNIAFQALESRRLHDILTYLNPTVDRRGCIPVHKTIKRWISTAYSEHLGIVTEVLASSISKVHISFDLWTSRSLYAFCGINVHFLDSEHRYRTFLLGLPRHLGDHSGVNIAETISKTIAHFGLQERLGCFITDNASNNDTAIQALAQEFGFNPFHRRLRCAGHILNLVARALLFGKDPDAFEELCTLEKTELENLLNWRKHGPPGKLHNIIVWIRASPQRIERFAILCATHSLIEKDHTLIADNDTRWNSFFLAMTRAIELRPVIDDILNEELTLWTNYERKKTDNYRKPIPENMKKKPDILDDYLSQDDWSIINQYHAILQPLWTMTLRLQGNGEGGSHGVIWQVLPCMEKLLSHFEELKLRYIIHTADGALSKGNDTTEDASLSEEYRMLCIGINLGWQKLNEYYMLTDRSPYYLAAVVLHPRYTWKFIKSKWRNRKDWIVQGELEVRALWDTEYASRSPAFEETHLAKKQREDSDLELSSSDSDTSTNGIRKDEYTSWCQRPRDTAITHPLSYWTQPTMKRTFPRLLQMALDVFTIPAMSDEPERTFSSTGIMVRPHRSNLDAEIIGHMQCVKSWKKQGVVDFHSAFLRPEAPTIIESIESE